MKVASNFFFHLLSSYSDILIEISHSPSDVKFILSYTKFLVCGWSVLSLCVHVSACVCELSVSVCASEWCDSVCMGGEDTFPPSPQLQYLFYKQGSYYKMK